jgi:hypothetical protein
MMIKNQIFKFRETDRRHAESVRVRGAKKARFCCAISRESKRSAAEGPPQSEIEEALGSATDQLAKKR